MQSPGWYVRRLKAMSLREVMFRAGRSASTQVERLLANQMAVPPPDLSRLPDLAIAVPDVDTDAISEKALRIVDGYIDVFAIRNYCIGKDPDWHRDPKTGLIAPSTFGKSIDYRNERIVGNVKYLWEPSRHLMLPVLAQAFGATGDKRFFERLIHLLESWIAQCRYPFGPQWCSSLEAGIRLINWSMAWRICGCLDGIRRAGASDSFIQRWLGSVSQHLHFIDSYYSGYSSANNHLIGEAAGVYVGTATWPAWPECETLMNRARATLIQQAKAQTHPDGVNAEQAISYQQFVVDFLLLAGLTADDVHDPFPRNYWQTIERMLEFVAAIMDTGGNVPMIGDADDGYVVDLGAGNSFANYSSQLATGAVIFKRPDFATKVGVLDDRTRWLLPDADRKYAAEIGHKHTQSALPRSFPHGGYFVLGSDLDTTNEVRIVVDAGPLGFGPIAAHGHADALSFTLSVSGTPFLIDPGTYSYHTDQRWRDYFRGTSAHNTVRVDGLDQSVIGGNFLWTRHARVTVQTHEVNNELQHVGAYHDGYARLDDPVIHRRTVTYDCRKRRLTIQDHFECEAEHDIEQFFHLAEYVVARRENDSFYLQSRDQRIALIHDTATAAQAIVGDEELPLGWVSYRFDSKLPATTLRATAHICGPTLLTTRIEIL